MIFFNLELGDLYFRRIWITYNHDESLKGLQGILLEAKRRGFDDVYTFWD
jgi:hypothetical protein